MNEKLTSSNADDEMVIDTSKMSEGQREALEIAEAARQHSWDYPTFAGQLFMGRFLEDLVSPFPVQSDEDRKIGDEFVAKVSQYLAANLDPDEVDITRAIPDEVMEELFKMGVFSMKIPKEYGGLGLSQVNYNRVMMAISSYCGATAVLASAHQSIGVPQPLKMWGTDAQKKKYFAKLAEGAISAFALTERTVGSDPAKMRTEAEPSPDGKYYTINGEKQWCTNSPIADLLVVMARTPSKIINGRERRQISAFIVERSTPGIELVHRCSFMGLSGMQNGILKFTNVKVPAENMIGGEGKGLRVALSTLNIGRLTLPAACTGMAKQCLAIARRFGTKRVQWGKPVGRHEAGQVKLAYIASTTFAMEAVTMLTSRFADLDNVDIRIEAAMAKLFCSESAWEIVDTTLQLCGGRGYENANSLKARGEDPYPVERMMRDARINLIIEGTSEVIKLFLAREALDPHLRLASGLLKKNSSLGEKASSLLDMFKFYATWYPGQWFNRTRLKEGARLGSLERYHRYVARTARRLARVLFHLMCRYQDRLEKKQILLAHLTEVGMELFVMAATCSYAAHKVQESSNTGAEELADLFCRQSIRRIKSHFRGIYCNDNPKINALAAKVLDGNVRWLEEGVIWIGPDE